MDVQTLITPEYVFKKSLSRQGDRRLKKEARILSLTASSPHTPQLRSMRSKPDGLCLQTEYISGQSAKDWLCINEQWHGKAIPWKEAKTRLKQYVEAEIDLLSRGIMYRDLNPEHILFSDKKAVLIDHESGLRRAEDMQSWVLDDIRGTWETMAPEEFLARGIIFSEIATYRVAVFSYLVLTGELPFLRKSTRKETHKWRIGHPPIISQRLPYTVRKIFGAALARSPSCRHSEPSRFFDSLCQTLDSI